MYRFNARKAAILLLMGSLATVSRAQTLNCNLLSDTQSHAVPSVAKPGYRQSYVDPVFGTKITRISGDPGTPILGIAGGYWGNVVWHHYAKDQAWNADGSLIYLGENSDGGTGPVFLDGNTYLPLFQRSPPSNSDVRWSPTDPNLMFFAANSNVGYFNVRTGAVSVLRSFPGYRDCKIGPWEGNLTPDGTMVAISCTLPNGHPGGFAYNIKTDTKYPDMDIYNYGQTMMDAIQISPKGNYLVASYGPDDEQILVTDLNGKLIQDFYEYGRPSHFDLTVDQNGDEVAVGVAKSHENGKVIKRRLRDGQITVLTPAGGFATHTSTRNTGLPGYAFTGYADDSSAPYYNELVMSKLDGSRVYRLGHTHNHVSDYKTESHGSASRDGMRVIFKSTWGGTRPVQLYVVDLRDRCSVSNPTPPATTPPVTSPAPPTTTPPAGSNLVSQGKPSTASSFEAGSEPGKANDGDPGSRWVAASGRFPQTYQVDLGANYDLSNAKILNDTNNYLKYRIEVSRDNVSFATVVDKTGNTLKGSYENALNAKAMRYVRVTVTGATSGYWAYFYELQVFGTPAAVTAPRLLSAGKPVTASSYGSGTEPGKAVDGSMSSRWVSGSGAFPQSFQVDLGGRYDLTGAKIFNDTNNYLKYRIEVSADGTAFKTVVDKTGNTTVGNYENALAAGGQRYVRVTITGATAGFWAYFYELQIFGK